MVSKVKIPLIGIDFCLPLFFCFIFVFPLINIYSYIFTRRSKGFAPCEHVAANKLITY